MIPAIFAKTVEEEGEGSLPESPRDPRRYARAFAVVFCLPTLLAIFARWSWFCDLFTHYRVYYAALLLPCGTVLLFFRGLRPIAAAVFIVGLWNACLILPVYLPAAAAPAAPHERSTIRILIANVHSANRRYERLGSLIVDENPDLVLLMEVNGPWLAALEDTLDAFGHRVERPRDDNFGIALYSRLPLADATIKEFGQAELPSIVAQITIGSENARIVGTHLLPPISASGSQLRNEQLSAIAGHLRGVPGAHLVIGDFNSTSWSPWFTRFVRSTGLRDSRRGFGIQPTWFALGGLIRLPIDHVLTSGHVTVKQRRVGPDIGSDHRPVIVDLSL